MTACLGRSRNDLVAHFAGKTREIAFVEATNVGGDVDTVQKGRHFIH